MKRHLRIPSVLLAVGLASLWGATGCDWDDDDDYDHNPPPGMGSIVVDNYTYTDIEVYVDGDLVGKVNDDHDKPFDLAPGVYRVVLNDEDDERNWAGDVDVLENRLTILTVRVEGYDDYDVDRRID